MKTRLLKELRSIRLPLIAAVAAALCLPHSHWFGQEGSPGYLFWQGTVWVFASSLLIICADLVGVELQQQTLPLLLSQPISRARLWSEKLALSAACVLSLAALGAWMIYLGESEWESSLNYLVPLAVFATVCSCGLWTLLARSTLGGMVLRLAALCPVY